MFEMLKQFVAEFPGYTPVEAALRSWEFKSWTLVALSPLSGERTTFVWTVDSRTFTRSAGIASQG